MHSSFIRLGLGILLAGTCCSLSAQGPQTQDSDPGGNAEAPRVIMRKLPPGSAKLITASDESKNSAIEIFRAATLRRDKLIFVDYDFLLRKCLIRSGQVVDPQWEVGNVTENFSSGDFQIESMALKSSLSADEIAGSKSRGEAWLKERERLRDFIKVQRDGESFLPIETSLDPITPYFSREEFEPRTGGVCLNTENMSLRGRLGSKLIVIESPGLTIPKWIHYFDARALGFSSALEISW